MLNLVGLILLALEAVSGLSDVPILFGTCSNEEFGYAVRHTVYLVNIDHKQKVLMTYHDVCEPCEACKIFQNQNGEKYTCSTTVSAGGKTLHEKAYVEKFKPVITTFAHDQNEADSCEMCSFLNSFNYSDVNVNSKDGLLWTEITQEFEGFFSGILKASAEIEKMQKESYSRVCEDGKCRYSCSSAHVETPQDENH